MNKTSFSLTTLILLFIIAVLTGCAKGAKTESENTTKEYSFHFNGVEGDVSFYLTYCSEGNASLRVKNNTIYTLLVGEPVLLFSRLENGKWQALYTSALSGIDRIVERGAERELSIRPDHYELKKGTYMIETSGVVLEMIIEAGKESAFIEPTDQSRQLVFEVR